jgi:Concanavalin A-like lectin/glucanases superfamily/PKD domain
MFLTPQSWDGTLRFAITAGGSQAEERLNAPSLTPDTWTHVAVTLDGSTGVLYVNGSRVDTQTIHLTPDDVVGANTWLGKSQYEADPTFAGRIDEVAVFDRALSESEISGMVSSGWDSLSGKVLGLHMDESPATHGTTLADASGEGNHGTLYTFGGAPRAGAPAVAANGDEIDLFARTADGRLGRLRYDGSTWGNWTHFAGLGVGAVYNTGATTVTPPGNDAMENLLLDVETGYFTGDGRQQIVLAYQSTAAEIRIEVYDVRDGFAPLWMARALIAGEVPRITAADVDGDGIDEIGIAHLVSDVYHYKVEIYDIERRADGSWTGNLTKLPNESPTFLSCSSSCNDPLDDLHWFAGTLRISSGDFVAEPEGVNANEEIAVLSDWVDSRPVNDYDLWVQLYLLDNDHDTPLTACRPDLSDESCPIADGWRLASDGENHLDNSFATGFGLGAGDVDGNGYDEIVLTWPYWFDEHDWPDLVRTLRVLNARDVHPDDDSHGLRQPKTMAEYAWIPPVYQIHSYLDTLVVGDLDRDLQDEIVVYTLDELQFYEYNNITKALQLISTVPSMSGIAPKVSLAMGDFTGESLRVGPPSYRVQNRLDSIVAIINVPPKHADYIKDEGGNYQLIEVLTQVCWDSPADPRCTHAKFATKEGATSSTANKSQRDWMAGGGLDAKIEMGRAFVDLSLKYSYRNVFEKYNETVQSSTYAQTTMAYQHDQIVHYGTRVGVWEYPLFDGASDVPVDYLTLMFPLLDAAGGKPQSPQANARTGDYPGEPWLAAGHQTYNIWSYDPLGPIRFPDYQAENLILDAQTQGGGFWFESSNGNTDVLKTTTTVTHDASAEIGGGVKGEFDTKLFGKFGANIRAYVKDSYKEEDVEIDELKNTEETVFTALVGQVDTSEAFTTRMLMYRSDQGHLVLDHQTDIPDAGMWLQYYHHPDPAFILPWYGLPYPGSPYPSTSGLERFSPEIQVTPAYASVGEPVILRATVRNFSNVPAQVPVVVRFYQGDPAEGHEIGETQIAPPFDRANGPVTVQVEWHAEGRGEQKIYAVIDPDNAVDPELHDEDDVVNNNVAYGKLQVGSAIYGNMGLAAELPYQVVSYAQSSVKISAHVPPKNLDQVTYFELQDAELSVARCVGRPFELVAYLGEDASGGAPRRDLPLHSEADEPPAVMTIAYDDADITGMSEAGLKLYLLNGSSWSDATCEGYAIQRFPEDNRLAVPVCRTGAFVLSDETPGPTLAPVAHLSAAPTSGPAPLTVNFIDQSSNYPTGWLWNFGDEGTSIQQNPIHTYTAAGSYTVTLTVTNAAGSDTLTEPDYITVVEAKRTYLPLVFRSAP